MLHLAKETLPEGPVSADLHLQAAALNDRLRHHGATDVLRAAVNEIEGLALVSSFGAESVVLLHLLAMVDPAVPVLFIDTEMLFTETLVYQTEVSERLGLTNLRVIRAADIAAEDPDNTLHLRDTDACCDLRKTRPLERALAPFQAWVTGRKRFQTADRANLELFEVDAAGRIKLNPLADWDAKRISEYMDAHDLPRHPMVAEGFPSLGCAPCTTKVRPGEDPRAGRWRGSDKTECGIHIVDGKIVRGNPQAA